MKTDEIYASLLGCSVSGYYKWKKQQRSIVSFLEKCFTKDELEYYLLTGEIPAKIEYANHFYAGMYEKLAYFITDTLKNKVYLTLLFTYESLEDTPKKAFELYENGMITQKELIDFLGTYQASLSPELLLYIKENIKQAWKIFEKDIKQDSTSPWLFIYLEIIKLSIEHECFDKTFGNPNLSEDFAMKYVPNPPELFSAYQGWEAVQEQYIKILTEVKNSFLNNSLEKLPLWSVYDTAFTVEKASSSWRGLSV